LSVDSTEEVAVGNANSGRYPKLTPEERKRIISLVAAGLRPKDIAVEIQRSKRFVERVIRADGGLTRPVELEPSSARLSAADREEIRCGLAVGESFAAIARRLGRHTSTVSREVNRNGGRARYAAWRAHRHAGERARRPKPAKLATCAKLRAQVEQWLEQLWSPVQIAAMLRIEYPQDPMMRVSHETIYQSLYVQGRGALRKELALCLRTGRAVRRNRSRLERRGRLPDMVMISDRPAEIEDRAVPGHWEGDLVIGRNGRSAVGTLVERSTRYVMLLHLPGDRSAETVRDAITAKIATLPEHLVRSITWDQGSEMAQHAQFSIDTGVAVYFCDPHSPWQRGSNENTNGLLRQYLPKGTDLSIHTEADLDAIAHSLNNRPRQTLGWMKPSERLAQLVASTA
jgi:IS30 family transposase